MWTKNTAGWLGVIVAIFAITQRIGGYENKRLAWCLFWLASLLLIGWAVMATRELISWVRSKRTPVVVVIPSLQYSEALAGDWSSERFRQPLTVEVTNTAEKAATGVVAKARFDSDSGTTMTVDPTAWIVEKLLSDGHTWKGLRPEVNLEKGESQQVVLLFERSDNGARQACEADMDTIIGTLAPDRWKVTISAKATGEDAIEKQIHFTVTQDQRLIDVW